MGTQTFEVCVKVKQGAPRYQSSLGMYVRGEVTKMFHIDARTGEQAMQRCAKYGRPISCHKADAEKMLGDMEHLQLGQEQPESMALAMDEFLWKKRNNRIKNHYKDKDGLT